jgi:hypothetical protein
MKAFILACLLLVVSSCKKFDGGDISPQQETKPVWPDHDTIPDHASFLLRLVMDSTDYDETAFIFNHKAGLAYNFDSDGSYLQGFGKVSLASISSDGRDLAIYDLPYSRGLAVGLDVNSKKDAMLSLKISRENNIPANIGIWVKDSLTKDSLDLRKSVYCFHVTKADTNSFGNKRFRLVLTSDEGQ